MDPLDESKMTPNELFPEGFDFNIKMWTPPTPEYTAFEKLEDAFNFNIPIGGEIDCREIKVDVWLSLSDIKDVLSMKKELEDIKSALRVLKNIK